MDIKKTRLRDWINPKKWWSFVKSQFINWFVTENYFKQLMFRYTMPECQPCIKAGNCVHCGCNTFQKMLNPNETCSGGYWGEMQEENDYNTFEAKHNIEIKQNNNLPEV